MEGIMNGDLKKHLKIITEAYKKREKATKEMCELFKTIDLDYDPAYNRKLSDIEATRLRNLGNTHFQRGNYHKARLLYTQSLAFAISGPLAALAYANRSVTLLSMNLYEDALKDIDRAAEHKYPDELKYKLFLRRARCLKYMNQDYSTALNDALNNVESHVEGEESENMKSAIIKDMDQGAPKFNAEEMPKPHDWTVPTLSYGVNTEVPCFSSAVSLSHSKELGRHIVANRPLKTGDVLVVDKCILSALGEEVHWDLCSMCYRICFALIPCQTCGYVMYCSEKCRTDDWEKSHRDSCYYTKACYSDGLMGSMFDQMQTNAPAKLAESKTLNCMLQRLLAYVGLNNLKDAVLNGKPANSQNQGNPRTRGFKNGKFEEVTIDALLSLEDNIDKIDAATKLKFSQMALMLAGLHHIPESELLPMSAVFLKLFLIIFYNQKLLHAFKANYYRLGLPRTILGMGLYLGSSFINHACDPTMFQVVYGNTVVYRARRPVKKGEQLTDCYLVSLSNCPVRQRQELCMALHFFNCTCEGCEKRWPLVADMPSKLTNEIIPWLVEAGIEITDQSELKKFMYFCAYNVACDKDMLPKMKNLLEKFCKVGKKKHQWYFQMQESIKNHYRAHGNCFFFKDTEAMMNGVVKFDGDDAWLKAEDKLNNCIEVPGHFGLRTLV